MNKIIPFMLLFFFISGTFATAAISVSASELIEDTWNTINAMNQPRINFEAVTVDDKIYAIGGSAYSEYLSTNERYDPKTDRWITLASMPTPRENFIIVACQGKIYCMGGTAANDGTINDSDPILMPEPPKGTTDSPNGGAVYVPHPLPFRQVDVVEVYDPATNKWASKAHLSINVEGMHTQVVNGQIFIITPLGELYTYDPVTDKWSNKTPLSVKEEPLQTHAVNEQLFIITQSALCVYDPAKDTWTNKPNMPALMTYAFSVVVDNKLIVCDLSNISEIIFSNMYRAQLRINIYDPISDVWQTGKTTAEHIFVLGFTLGVTSGVYAPEHVYVLGREASKDDVFNVKPFTLVYNPVADVWSTAKVAETAPYSRGCKMVVVDDVFYIIGGVFNVKYVPVGYNSQGYPDTQPSATAPSASDVTSPDHPESEHTWSFLTRSVVIVTVLTISGVTALFFYLRARKRPKVLNQVLT